MHLDAVSDRRTDTTTGAKVQSTLRSIIQNATLQGTKNFKFFKNSLKSSSGNQVLIQVERGKQWQIRTDKNCCGLDTGVSALPASSCGGPKSARFDLC